MAFGLPGFRVGLSGLSACRDELRGLVWSQVPDGDLVPILVVADEDVARLRVVVLVEVVLAAGADEADRLACLERGHAVLVSVDDCRAAGAVGDIDDL